MVDDIAARIGRNLREYRLKAGLDLDALALLARVLARPLDDFFA